MTDRADQLYECVLVLRCQTGDEAAFAELVARYSPRLRYFLRKMLDDVPAAEDALQDVWLDVYRGVGRLADPAALPAWLYRIARDRAWRMLRGKQRNSRPLMESDWIDVNDTTFPIEEAARVHAGLGALPPDQREVLVLRFLEELSYEDIARIVGCPVGTVRSRIHYAKGALRRALDKEPPT
jgi:RNA polymerase sigma-70 factor (ECF subfamily)